MKLWQKLVDFHAGLSKGVLLAEAVFLVIVIGIIDYLTGYDVTFFPFYSIPILLLVGFASTQSAIAICVLSALAWRWADSASGHIYPNEFLHNWDTVVRLIFFWLVVTAGAGFRRNREADRAQIELLERTQRLERQIISISECEQQRLGQDLHDELGQHLVALGFAVERLKEDLEQQHPQQAEAAERIADQLHNAIGKARDMARGLSPVGPEEGSLEAALEQLAQSTSRLSGKSCAYVSGSPIPIQEGTQAVHLYRIAQEALNNAIKHSQAREVLIALESTEEGLCLRVSDNGIGFNSNSAEDIGMGLNIMHYRARTIGGVLTIQPNSPSGTLVTCLIPSPATPPSQAVYGSK